MRQRIHLFIKKMRLSQGIRVQTEAVLKSRPRSPKGRERRLGVVRLQRRYPALYCDKWYWRKQISAELAYLGGASDWARQL
jgi:hypothetical protein